MRLLIVEDNDRLAGLIGDGLKTAGFDSDRASSLMGAQDALSASGYSAIILDLGLPDGDGRSLVADLRTRGDSTPVLMLTARGTVDEKVSGLGSGADDYLVKPFAFEELIARLRALLRRPSSYLGNLLEAGNVSFDSGAQQAFVGGEPQSFSARELALLEMLLRRPGRVVPKRLAEDQLFGPSEDVRSNAVEVYMHRLRKQLADAGATVEVHTVRGVGYILTESKT
jgi:two-component system response regulator TctD